METPVAKTAEQLARKRKIKEAMVGYLFLLPAFTFFAIFVLYPMLKGIYLSLFRFRGRKEVFVGLKHYQDLFSDSVFLQSVRNTTFITAVSVPIVIIFALFVAINIYNKNAKIRSFFRGVFYLPAIRMR